MSSDDGSATPTQESYDMLSRTFQGFSLADNQSVKESLVDYARECSIWKLKTDIGQEQATTLANKILSRQAGSQGLARQHGVVPWCTQNDPNKGTLILCPLPTELVGTMQSARAFHESHLREYPSENTLQGFQDYYRNLTVLVDHLGKEQRKAGQTSSQSVKATRDGVASGKLSAYALTRQIPLAEDRLEGVMFPGPVGQNSVSSPSHAP